MFMCVYGVMKVCICRALRSGFQLIHGTNDGLFSNVLIDSGYSSFAVRLFRQQNLTALIELQGLFNLGNLGNTKVRQ